MSASCLQSRSLTGGNLAGSTSSASHAAETASIRALHQERELAIRELERRAVGAGGGVE